MALFCFRTCKCLIISDIAFLSIIIRNNESFQAELAKRAKECLTEEDEAFNLVLKDQDVMKWRDEEYYNWTLIHYAATFNYNTFLEKLFKDEKVVIIL